MRTAEQILMARFEKVVRAGMLADASTRGEVRRATLDAARAAVLYVGAGEVTTGVEIASEIAYAFTGTERAGPVLRSYAALARATGHPEDPERFTGKPLRKVVTA